MSTEVRDMLCGRSEGSRYHPHLPLVLVRVAFVCMKKILVSWGSLAHLHTFQAVASALPLPLVPQGGWQIPLAMLSPERHFAAPPAQPPPLPCFHLCFQHYRPCPRGPGRPCRHLLTTWDQFSVAVPFSLARCSQRGCEHSLSGLPHTWGLENYVSARNLWLSQSETGGEDLSLA